MSTEMKAAHSISRGRLSALPCAWRRDGDQRLPSTPCCFRPREPPTPMTCCTASTRRTGPGHAPPHSRAWWMKRPPRAMKWPPRCCTMQPATWRLSSTPSARSCFSLEKPPSSRPSAAFFEAVPCSGVSRRWFRSRRVTAFSYLCLVPRPERCWKRTP